MSANNIKKLSGLASGNSKKRDKLLEKLLNKPIKYTKVEENNIKSVGERLAEKLPRDFKQDNIGAAESIKKEVVDAPKNSSNEIKNNITSVEDLTTKLKDIEKEYENKTDSDFIPDEYKIKLPESLNQEKMDVPEVNKEEILNETTKEETLKTKAEKEKVEADINSEVDKLLSMISGTKNKASETKSEINKVYDDYKLAQENDTLKRGLARSSVAVLALDGIEKERAAQLSSHAKEVASEITEMEKEISSLQTKLNKSLENLDLELSININNKMAEKIEVLEKKRQEAIEFNNNIEKLEADYQAKRLSYADEAKELEEFLKEKYEGVAKAKKTEEMSALAYDYFSGLDKTVALREIIKTPELVTLLGDGYYDLYYKIMRG